MTLLLAGCTTTTPLIDAAARGDTTEVKRLIAEGSVPNERGTDTALSWTPLVSASYNGNTEIARLLIEKGANINEGTIYGTPLISAVDNGHIEVVRLLIEKGADVHKSWDGSPLYHAAYAGNIDIVRLLIKNGADPNRPEKYKTRKSPLGIAIEKGHISIVNLLQNSQEIEKLSAKPDPIDQFDEMVFAEVASKYRTAMVKPDMSEAARKNKVLAEYAIKKNDFKWASSYYQEALKIDPWWPEGHFNRALILGELSRYQDAIREMKKYLLLVSDAPDAHAAQDKIYMWESELK